MSSSDETYKRSIKSSYQRQIKKARSRDEQRLLAENRKQRGKADKSRRTRKRDWDAADDDAETFEVMRPAPQVDLVRALRERGAAAEETQAFEPNALVVGVFPDRATVWLDGAARAAFLDERAPRPAVGDEALVEARGDGELRLVGLAPRRSVIARSDPGDARRELVLAANVDVAVIVAAAARPGFRPGLVDRFLVALERGGVAPLLALNKVDLVADDAAARAALEEALRPYRELGVDVVEVSAESGVGLDALRARLAGRTCVFVGHSGVGKSTLLNRLDPAREREINAGRAFDGKGRHTTTSSELVELDDGTRLVDTPGIRTLGLAGLAPAELAACFPDLAELAPGCRFNDCTHVVEPGCAVRAAVARGALPEARHAVYARLFAELGG